MHQFTNLSVAAVPFQPQAALPTHRLAGAARGLQEPGEMGQQLTLLHLVELWVLL